MESHLQRSLRYFLERYRYLPDGNIPQGRRRGLARLDLTREGGDVGH